MNQLNKIKEEIKTIKPSFQFLEILIQRYTINQNTSMFAVG